MTNPEITMREYVRQYIPHCWEETIETVVSVPFWSEKEYDSFSKREFGTLAWYFIEAIKDYFNHKGWPVSNP